MNLLVALASTITMLFAVCAQSQTHPAITSWLINTTGVTGRHYVAGNPSPLSDTAQANVQIVRYSEDYAYINSSGIPAYVIGPYRDGNPSQAVHRNYLFKIPLKPAEQKATKTAVGLGQIAVLINGVPIYNYADARSYNNQNVWHQNAIFFERTGFDCAVGHPAPIMGGGAGGGAVSGQYHHHQNPTAFNIAAVKMSDVCDMYLADGLYVPDPTKHGPLIGFAFDGYPIYGAYGYATGTSTVKRITPSYRLRAITDRTTLANGTVLTAAQYGPTLATQPLGAYAEDFEYVPGLGDLDEHNGRFCSTPEYPNGTYAYFATIDESGVSSYPYVIGPSYYGVVVTDNFPSRTPGAGSTNVRITETVTVYTPTTTVPTITFTSQPVAFGNVGTAYEYTAVAAASTSDTIRYTLISAPQGVTLDTVSGYLRWSQPVAGMHQLQLRAHIVHKGVVHSATQSFTLTIHAPAPVTILFTSIPPRETLEKREYRYTVTAVASDTSKAISFDLRKGAPGMVLTEQGVLTWTSPVVGSYAMEIRARVTADTIAALQSYTLTVLPDTVTSVFDAWSALSLTILPNPAQEVVIVQVCKPLANSAAVTLFDVAGRTVASSQINQGSTMCFLDVQTVYAGLYVVRVDLGSNSYTYPIVIRD